MTEWSEKVRARLNSRIDATPGTYTANAAPASVVQRADLRAALAEIERLRESEKAASDCYAAAEAECNLLRAEAQKFRKENPDSMYLKDLSDGWERRDVASEEYVAALRARVRTLEDSMVRHFQEEHLAGDGPEIDRWKLRVRTLKALLSTQAQFTAEQVSQREERIRTLEEALREGEKILAPFEGSKAIPYQQLLDIARSALAGEDEP
jgi:hypothetical protein